MASLRCDSLEDSFLTVLCPRNQIILWEPLIYTVDTVWGGPGNSFLSFFSSAPPPWGVLWGRILTILETIGWSIAWKIVYPPWRLGKHSLRPRKWFHILFFFCLAVMLAFPFSFPCLSPFLVLHIHFTGLMCHLSINYIIIMALLLRLAQSHPWEK